MNRIFSNDPVAKLLVCTSYSSLHTKSTNCVSHFSFDSRSNTVQAITTLTQQSESKHPVFTKFNKRYYIFQVLGKKKDNPHFQEVKYIQLFEASCDAAFFTLKL
jgi:hypothetical protein